MKIGPLDFPENLLNALSNDNLAVFAGAGVSMGPPANLPNFEQLTAHIAEGTNRSPTEPWDQFLGILQHAKVDVQHRAVKALQEPKPSPTDLHRHLLRLFRLPEKVRVVTTNFDLLFEDAVQEVFSGCATEIFRAPALPIGSRFHGIVHIHGALNKPEDMILTDADFGRAYLTEGWARRFLVDLFQTRTVLFVGYSHDDVVMKYLARALPKSDVAERFVLIEEGAEIQQWRLLGITPITYHKHAPEDFGELDLGIQRLADFATRGILDWRGLLTEMGKRTPPVDEEGIGRIYYGLREAVTTRFLTETARIPDWPVWLNRKKKLEALFSLKELSEQNKVLAWWLAEQYAIEHPEVHFELISEHGMCLNPEFWWALGRELALNDKKPINTDALANWVTVLLATAPPHPDGHILGWLANRCATQGMALSVLELFDFMAKPKLILKPAFHWPKEKEDYPDHRFDIEQPLVADHYSLNEVWEKNLKQKLAEIPGTLLICVARRLEEIHYRLRAWQRADHLWDISSYNRAAIEPHEQDRYPTSLDVLIDAARDSLEWLANNKLPLLAAWIELLINSNVPLLRRLAIHATGARTDISADEKLHWLLERIDIHSSAVHHELYCLVHLAYPLSARETRKAIIEAILRYRWPKTDDEDRESNEAHVHFAWLHWLHTSDPQCDFAKSALDAVTARYPEFRPSECPDLTHWTGSGWVIPQSPWSVEELLAKPAKNWLPDLLSFKGDDFRGSDRSNLIEKVAEATKQRFSWGWDLAEVLSTFGHWDSDLWIGIIRGWPATDRNHDEWKRILAWLARPEIQLNHQRLVAEVLNGLVRNEGKSLAYELLPTANAIAAALWNHIDRTEGLSDHDDWLTMAINRPTGILAEFWLGSLSILLKHQIDKPTALPEDYRTPLTAMLQDQTIAGAMGRTVLASQFAFLLTVDAEWAREQLVPLFLPSEKPYIFEQAWDGFLAWGRLNPAVAEAMDAVFFQALSGLSRFREGSRQRFIEYLSALIAFYATDPLERWIPALFQHGEAKDRQCFAFQIDYFLRGMEADSKKELWQRWLRRYWENRLQGVPAALEETEIRAMLEWPVHLDAVYPEAVDLAVSLPRVRLDHTSVLHELKEKDFPSHHSDATVRFLVHLCDCGLPSYNCSDLISLFKKLSQMQVDTGLISRLRECLVRMGCTGDVISDQEE